MYTVNIFYKLNGHFMFDYGEVVLEKSWHGIKVIILSAYTTCEYFIDFDWILWMAHFEDVHVNIWWTIDILVATFRLKRKEKKKTQPLTNVLDGKIQYYIGIVSWESLQIVCVWINGALCMGQLWWVNHLLNSRGIILYYSDCIKWNTRRCHCVQ